jgi:serine/threonine protein kinase
MTSVDTPPSGRDPVDSAARDDLRGLFELETVHRRGPASLVCLARDLEFNQPVALKVMARASGARAEAEEGFQQAAALVAALEHPHVVPLYSAGATDRFFWCSMEYVEGRSLAEVLRSSVPMEPSAPLRLAGQVAAALDDAHRLGVVHAGLTPANVLIDAAGDAHVTDFWIPWVLERLGGLPGDGGKARREKYRAPEQVSQGRCGPEGDQYSLAALLQACLTKARARLLPDIARAIERALSPTPEARFPSVSEFAAALGVSARRAAVGTLPQFLEDDDEDDRDEYDPSDAPRPSRWRWIPAGVVTLVVLGAVAAPWLLSSGSRRAAQRSADEEYLRPAVDSVPFVDPAVRLDTVVPPPRAERRPVSPVAPVRRPSVAPPRRARPVPERRDVAAPAVGGRLFVNSTPWGQVYVDSELIGNTPRVDVPVSPGAHRLRVVRDGFLPYDTTVRITPGQALRITDIVLQEIKP